jgi:hypothetical protein
MLHQISVGMQSFGVIVRRAFKGPKFNRIEEFLNMVDKNKIVKEIANLKDLHGGYRDIREYYEDLMNRVIERPREVSLFELEMMTHYSLKYNAGFARMSFYRRLRNFTE